MDEKFWKTLRRLWLEYLNDHLEELAKNQKKFTKNFLKLLKEKGYVLTPELIKEITNWIDHAQGEIQNLIQFSVLVVTRATSMRDEEAARLAAQLLQHRWEDGLNLSERIWNLKQEQIRLVGDVLRDGVYRGAGAKKLAYELQYHLEGDESFKLFLKEGLPKWLDQIVEQLKPLVKDPEGEKKLRQLRTEIEKKIKRYARSIRNYARTKKLIEDIAKAIEEGSYELIDRAIHFYLYDKQLQRFERIARTESAYAYTETLKSYAKDLDYLKGFKWELSSRHKVPDICDFYAKCDCGLGKGVHPPEKVPRCPAHPNCLCHLIPVVKRRVNERVKELPNPQVPKEVVRQAAPKYVQYLDALGLPWEHLFDWENGKWKLRRKDIINAIGEDGWKKLQQLATKNKVDIAKELSDPQVKLEIGTLIKQIFDAAGIPIDADKAHLVPVLGYSKKWGFKVGDSIGHPINKVKTKVEQIFVDFLWNERILSEYERKHIEWELSKKDRKWRQNIRQFAFSNMKNILQDPDRIVFDQQGEAIIYAKRVVYNQRDRWASIVVGLPNTYWIYTAEPIADITKQRYIELWRKI